MRSDQEKIINKLKSTENSIIIYFADLQDKINNEENNFKINVPQTINELASNNVVILITSAFISSKCWGSNTK